MPHPDKVHKGGEDAGFIGSCDRCFGVADGVGGWATQGVDAGLYSRELMKRVEASTVAARKAGGGECQQPWQSLKEGFEAMDPDTVGSCTAVVLSVKRDVLEAANLGDSGFSLWRYGATDEPGHRAAGAGEGEADAPPPHTPAQALLEKPAACIAMSKPQTFAFNAPHQLGHHSTDKPEGADRYTLTVKPGDVIVTGTDGLWDNLFLSNVNALLEGEDWEALAEQGAALLAAEAEGADPEATAKAREELTDRLNMRAGVICKSAVHVAHDLGTMMTPFSVEAEQYGYRWPDAGKPDDTYVMVSLVVAEPGDEMFYC